MIEFFHSDFRIVVDYFVRKRNNPSYSPNDPQKLKHIDVILKLMYVLTQDELI